MLDLLKKVKKLKVKELKVLERKLQTIKKHKQAIWDADRDPNTLLYYCTINLDDLREALTYCEYHFCGGLLEDEGLDKCPCSCYCINCEIIPTQKVSKRMQEIAQDMGEENVMHEFFRDYKTMINSIEVTPPNWMELITKKENDGK